MEKANNTTKAKGLIAKGNSQKITFFLKEEVMLLKIFPCHIPQYVQSIRIKQLPVFFKCDVYMTTST